MTFHSLRRTYGSLMAENGADAAFTMAQIGHKTPGMTLGIYTDVGNHQHPLMNSLEASCEARKRHIAAQIRLRTTVNAR